MTRVLVVVSLTFLWNIPLTHALKCYSCRGRQDCGPSFSAQSSQVTVVESASNETLSSCAITVTPEGLTIRERVPAYSCRSSSSQYCCNEDLCNSLPSPPLPALTSLKCIIGTCTMANGICISDVDHVTALSGATESCSITYGDQVEKSYKKACQPTLSDTSRTRLVSLKKVPLFCCNSAECNRDVVVSGVSDPIIQCYTCDSRITGEKGCSVFDQSSEYVYKAGSSSRHESCATVTGLAGKDSITGKEYPSFTIRTFIRDCQSKSLGTVSYGGATFRGQIDCCSKDFCNTKTTKATKSRFRMKRTMKIAAVGGVILVVLVLLGILVAVILRFRPKESGAKYNTCATSEVRVVFEPIASTRVSAPSRSAYPDPTEAP